MIARAAALLAVVLVAAACEPGRGSDAGAPPGSARAAAPAPRPLDTSWQSDPGRLLAAGDLAPDFEGIAHTGMRVRLGAFLDKPVVVYFCERDGAAPCTALARQIRDAWLQLNDRASMVIGVSADDRVAHKDFATAEELPFLVVADEDHAIARAFGLAVSASGSARATFLIGVDRRIIRVFSPMSPEGHAAEIAAALGALPR